MATWFFQCGLPEWLAYGTAGLLKCLLVLGLVIFTAMLALWMERKIAGRIQDRLGPTRTGGRFGWLQSPADGLKLLMKEDIIPAAADPVLFRLAPYISFCAAFCVFVVLPFSDGWAAAVWDSALFFFLAMAGLEVFGVILAGYSSGSKWSLFGAMREAAQVVSYEVPLGLCVVVPVLVAGTMDMVQIGRLQEGWFTQWLVFHDPFTFLTFWIYAACATAGVNRAPFDLPEAESELVAGFATEYSGFRWSIFFMAEYASMLAVSGFGTILFFGGWNGPIPVCHWLGLLPENGVLAAFLGNALGAISFLAKAFLGIVVMIWIRWSLPRLRIDQVMTMCWKYCVPLATAMLVGAVLWQAAKTPRSLPSDCPPPSQTTAFSSINSDSSVPDSPGVASADGDSSEPAATSFDAAPAFFNPAEASSSQRNPAGQTPTFSPEVELRGENRNRSEHSAAVKLGQQVAFAPGRAPIDQKSGGSATYACKGVFLWML